MTGANDREGGASLRRPRLLATLVLALGGFALLAGLCVWQIQRLGWKEDLIAHLESRLAGEAQPLPQRPDRARDEFRRFVIAGQFTGERGGHGYADAAYLTTARPWGAGYRVIQPFLTEAGRVILVDRGYVPLEQKNRDGKAALRTPALERPMTLTGALRWPQRADSFADPEAGPEDNVWLTREVGALAPLWGAEPVLFVTETATAEGAFPRPLPVSVDLPNDHREYAITWGALALIWAGMSAALLRRELRAAPGSEV